MVLTKIAPLVTEVPLMFSPSKVNFILKCPLRGLFDNPGNREYRQHGNMDYALLGNLIHLVYKLANEKEAGSAIDFDGLWEICENKEAPGGLKQVIPDYGKIKFLTRIQVAKSFSSTYRRKQAGYYSEPEKTITDEASGLKGQPDLVLFQNFKPYEIKDYKTGKVFSALQQEDQDDEIEDTFERLKEDYKNQLYLYTFLVFKKFGNYPGFLTIVPPDGQEIRTQCDIDAVSDLVNALLDCKAQLNTSDLASLARPNEENCKYCPFKPGCTWHYRLDGYLKDLAGQVIESKTYPYGNFSLLLDDGRLFFFKTVWGENLQDISSLQGMQVFISNVREEDQAKKLYTPTKGSVLYIKKIAA